MPGTLFVVATPIGNLEDLTFRALRTLREVDLIAAEDTRRTSKLLAHYEIQKSLVSLREHNEAQQGARLVADLENGKRIALVTDAGTPGIADPGARFVRLARDHKIKVVPIPGCSAITAALSASGVSADEFVFAGFAPPRAKLDNWLNDLKSEHRTVVFFETPHSISRNIDSITSKLVDRPIIIWRELTKLNEESLDLGEGGQGSPPQSKGELVVVVGPEPVGKHDHQIAVSQANEISQLLDYLTKYPTLDRDIALTMVGCRYDMKPSQVRKAIKRHLISVKRQNDAAG